MSQQPLLFHVKQAPEFPNSRFPVVLYHQVLALPAFFREHHIKKVFAANQWTNAWDGGIFTYHHYHSISHEALGFYEGSTTIQLGGPGGPEIVVLRGDVLIIPAGIVHKNLGDEHQVQCIGAYPDGRDFDIKTGEPGERPAADRAIAALPVPAADPILGRGRGISQFWNTRNFT